VKRIFAACMLGLLCAVRAMGATVEEDVQRYVALYKGDKNLHNAASESLAWMGLSDPRLFDVIEQQLLADHAAARNDRHEQRRVALYVRALGFSGQSKYVPTLTRFQSDPAYQRFAKDALEDIPDYQRWNPVISDRSRFDPKQSDAVNRVLNMLRSDDMQLKRLGAKRIYFENHDEVLLDALAQELKAGYPKVEHANEDALSWMVKALGRASGQKYRALFEEVRGSRNSKLSGYAKKALEGRL
jgi:hypothetical protein